MYAFWIEYILCLGTEASGFYHNKIILLHATEEAEYYG